MKKTITLVLTLVLTLCLCAGCRDGETAENMATDASRMIDDMTPRSDNGRATDGDGFIDDGARNSTDPSNQNGAMMPNM